ncbi:SCO family protein [Bradyrhizobium sp. JYMT SZCCT0428]|uniref:SCO family protein n=1 Tax=Bradyrhizobium sp. JYMT SZCCT0428 TaxID=2807673 RepID=UPI001BA468EE|nr:SCO family protein [Bradyrhizobium sp. JYMT SZCCT0428]MBR1149482.1 SCO family protein [Bradyrhizobium sp. JYMT SZCCT0428]
MPRVKPASQLSEAQFAVLVDGLADDPGRRDLLTELLHENHPVYAECGAAAVVRMRGWILVALARAGVPDGALIFLLEELDAGVDPYLVAAAARALRSYPRPTETFAAFVMRALSNIRYRDEPVSFEAYGEYAMSAAGTSPVQELLETLAWLGPLARGVLPELMLLRAQCGAGSRKLRVDIDRAIRAISAADQAISSGTLACCGAPPDSLPNTVAWTASSRRDAGPIGKVVLEDHDGNRITFEEFFKGKPAIVVFFYTRCDNPMKCSLTVAKLAHVQGLLDAQGLGERIQTAAITYDPAFDLPERLRIYGQDRGVRLDARHRMLRALDNDALRRHFELGVNFIESLVNRHRIEVYILDSEARIAVSFERIHWDEREVVTRAIELLEEREPGAGQGQPRSCCSSSVAAGPAG